jgi:flavodoxin I
MKTLILYGSTTGNTEQLAATLKDHLSTGGLKAELKEVVEVTDELIKEHELLLLGSSTWGEGELQEDFEEFYEGMGEYDFQGKRFAVFGSGDEECYPDTFCAAVGIIEEKLSDLGATRIIDGLKIDENDADEEKLLHNWADQLLDEANSEKGV